MKKALTPILAILCVVAIVLCCVFGVQKGNVQKLADDAKAALETAQADLTAAKTEAEQKLADAEAASSKALDDAKAAAEQKLADAQAAADSIKAELEKKLTDAEATKENLEKQLSDAQTAAESAKADLEKQLSDAQAAAETAKADLEKQLADAQAAAETAKADLEKQLADAQAAAEATQAGLEQQLADAQAAADAAKATLEQQLADAQAAVSAAQAELTQAKADSEKQLADLRASADKAVKDAKADAEKQLADAQTAADQATEDAIAAAKAEAAQTLADTQAAAEAAKAELEQKLAGAEAEVDAVKAELAQAREELETAKTDLAAAQDELATTKAAAAEELQKALSETQNADNEKLEAAKDAKADAEQQLADAQTAANQATELLQSQVDELKAKAEDLEGKLAQAQRNLIAAQSNAYLMYASADWSKQNWGTYDAEDGKITVTPAKITGEGDYTVGIEFAEPAEGLAFTAIGIDMGEYLFPGYYIKLNEIRINGAKVDLLEGVNGYTSSDDGIVTRMNIYNEWVAEIPDDAHVFDGRLESAAAVIVDKDAFAYVKSVEVDFSFLEKPVDNAYIMYANADWSKQNWGITDSEDGLVKVTTAKITGAGNYTVGLEFAEPADGLAFTALGIQHGEITYPDYFITINEIRINGEKIEALEGKKGYTSSDNQIETRMNIYNEWVSDLPEDARSLDGDLTNAAPVWVDKELFNGVKTMEIDFSFLPISAYIMYANADWSVQNWGYASTDAVKVTPAGILKDGVYYVTTLEFAEPSEGLAFMALGLKNGEEMLPNSILTIDSVRLNDSEEALPLKGLSYTNSDDGKETRANIYNEWVSALPEDARNEIGNLDNATPMLVDPAAFTGVKKIEVTFKFVKGQPKIEAASAELSITKEEADALKAAGFDAYIGVQGKDTYVFRNNWDEANYGRDSEANPGFFNRLTGWDESNNAVDYGGTFEDVKITGDGDYTVSLTTGDMGFGTTEAFNMLFASTTIPSSLVNAGYLTIDNVRTKIGNAATQDYTEIDTKGDYVLIKVLDSYNQSAEPFGYTVPGANETISVTFTVSGW